MDGVLTRGDRLIYAAAGIGAGLIGDALGALERRTDGTPAEKRRRSLAQDYAGPMQWLSHYILRKDGDRSIPRGSSYHDHWLHSIDSELAPLVSERLGLSPWAQAEASFRGECTDAARAILAEGLKFSASERPGYAGPSGLYCMIGGATVTLEHEVLRTQDVFDFENVRDPVVLPGALGPLVGLAGALSPALRQHTSRDGRRYLISDAYFSQMGGSEFTTRIEGPLQDLNRFGWRF